MNSQEQSPTYEMASLLFIDIVGYSLRSIDEQAEVLTTLQQIRDSAEYKRARIGNRCHRVDLVPRAVKSGLNSIAVLPFENLSEHKDQQYLSEGLSEKLADNLTEVRDLHVTGTYSSSQFAGKKVDPRVAGKTLGVATVLIGSMRVESKRALIRVQLLRARDGSQMWAKNFDRGMNETFEVKDEIAMA